MNFEYMKHFNSAGRWLWRNVGRHVKPEPLKQQIFELGHQLILSQLEEDPCVKTGHPAFTSEAH